MKKIALLLVVAGVAVSPAAAATKKKANDTDPNEASWRLVRDASPLILPSWAQAIYFSTMYKDKDADKKKKKQ